MCGVGSGDVDRVVAEVRGSLGPPAEWGAPVEFRDSLALCALNSSYSLWNSSGAVRNVVARYYALRPSADTDSGPDLMHAMDDAGGPEAFARDVLDNRSVLPGTRKVRTVGIYEGLGHLRDLDVRTAAELRNAALAPATKRAWKRVHGLGDMGWRYLIMNAGVTSETKPDVMVQRFITRALGEGAIASPRHTSQLVKAAADELGVEVRSLDRAIWLHESPRG